MSPAMASGYRVSGEADDPGLGHFKDGWFYPGDIGRLFEDGLLAIEGRANDTINIGGWKADAAELEREILLIPQVIDVCACVLPLDSGDELTFAIVCRDAADLKAIAGAIRNKLPKGRRFRVARLRAVPRNAMGKIPRGIVARELTKAYQAKRGVK